MLRYLAFIVFASCAALGAPTATKPNIVFVLTDDHSYPFLGCYGTAEMKTPNIDKFAGEGIKFHRMFTCAPQCVPSRASIMTGRSPVACRIRPSASNVSIFESGGTGAWKNQPSGTSMRPKNCQ